MVEGREMEPGWRRAEDGNGAALETKVDGRREKNPDLKLARAEMRLCSFERDPGRPMIKRGFPSLGPA